jgi:hypothetical protein
VEASEDRVPLGQLVLQNGLLNEEQLEIALAQHLSTGKPLGEVFVGLGYLTRDEVGALHEAQRESAAAVGVEPDARGIDLLRTRVAEAEAEVEQAVPDPAGAAGNGHVLFVWSPSGYALLSRSGDPPRVGSEVGLTGGSQIVVKLGPSPLPGDRRRCAYLDAVKP